MKSPEDLAPFPVPTADGSHTLLHPVLNEHYHSRHGAIQESEHIFIDLGLRPKLTGSEGRAVRVFEMGFGTGLNALLTWKLADHLGSVVHYTGLEAYPVEPAAQRLLNYDTLVRKQGFDLLHACSWEEQHQLSAFFSFTKHEGFLHRYQADSAYDLVYYDAFSPGAQPELWTVEIFERISEMMTAGAFLVTYSSKGSVRRALAAAGFSVEKHPGPKWKREVIRAVRK